MLYKKVHKTLIFSNFNYYALLSVVFQSELKLFYLL